MTRDPDRIDDICRRLAEVWKRSPDMRLGQIISSATPDRFYREAFGGARVADPFYVEDDELIQKIEKLLDPLNLVAEDETDRNQ